MKKMGFKKKNKCREYDFAIWVSCLSIFFSCCNAVNQNLEAKNESAFEIVNSQNQFVNKVDNSPTNADVKPTSYKCNNQTESVNFKGVSFQCKMPSVSEIEASEEPAIILEDERDKPDSVQSRRILFKLKGEYADRREEYFFSPRITIYPIAEYRQTFAKSNSLIETFDEEIKSIQDIISEKPSKIENLPFIPLIEMSSLLIAHIRYASFKNGEGYFYFAQFNVEPSVISNRGLTYVFQGITSDKKYYILATFPVTSKALAENNLADKFGGFESLQDIYEPKTCKVSAKYERYISSVKTLLNKQKESDFDPDLNKIEKTISSLEVNWQD